MQYGMHHDRIDLLADNGETIAQITFPEVGKGVCEITHVFGENSQAGRMQADRLMELAAQEIRRSGRKVIPGCSFAAQWFAAHPQEQDICTDRAALRRMEEALYGSATQQPEPVAAQQPAPVSAMQQQPAASDDKAASAEKARRAEARLDSSLALIMRAMQLISMLCMGAIAALFLSAAILQQAFRAEDFTGMVCAAMIVAFLIFCVLQLFWILSKKKVGGVNGGRFDVGRGIFGFIVVLFVCFACGLIINFMPGETEAFFAPTRFAFVFQVRAISMMYIAIAGLVLCFIRRFAGRQIRS